MAQLARRTGLRLLGDFLHVGSSPTVRTKRAISSVVERVAYIDEVAGPSPALPTRRGSSVVEHATENRRVEGSIPARGTNCGCRITVIIHPCQG